MLFFIHYSIIAVLVMAPSPSGKAKVCKTFIISSNLIGASNLLFFEGLIPLGKNFIWTNLICRCGEMADARDLKSLGGKLPCRFESGHRHQEHPNGCFFIFKLLYVLKVRWYKSFFIIWFFKAKWYDIVKISTKL